MAAPRLEPEQAAALRRRLLAWYRRNRRDLPWRNSADPYRVWLSEVMLQQTTVRTATPYYEAFLAKYPTLEALASADEDEVLAAWSGLGYYHRARNLLRAARLVRERHGGTFPKQLESALAIHGVGLYTASAVLSIAHGVPLPVVDGNVRRVLSRLFALRGAAWQSDPPFYALGEELLDREHPGDWNQALMELGAVVCTPRRPACPACPLRADCQALAGGLVDRIPEPRERRKPVDVTVAVAVVRERGRVLLVRRAEGRLLGRFWELPQTSLESRGLADLVREAREGHGLKLAPGALLATARHAITFRRIRVEAYAATLLARPPRDRERVRFVAPDELAALPLAALSRKALRGLDQPQRPLPFA